MYLSAQTIAALTGERRVHFLNDAAIRMQKSLGDAVGMKNLGIHLVTVAPGDRSTEYHAHHYEEEAIYILSGHGRATIGETTHSVGPGDFMGFPVNGTSHEMVNDGAAPLVYLMIGERRSQEITDYPRKAKRLYRHDGARDLVDRAAIGVPK